MNKLSVVLPIASYNLQWLDRCLESTKGLADELVIVTDGSVEVDSAIAALTNPWPLVIKVTQPGLARALNLGICAASGNWISFLCSDDWYLPGAQLIKTAAFNSPESYADIVGGVTHSTGYLGENDWPKNGDISRLETECSITSPALFRKSLWWNVNGYKDKRYLDWYFWKECIIHGARYQFHNVQMYGYQAWPGTISARYGYSAALGHEWGDGPKER